MLDEGEKGEKGHRKRPDETSDDDDPPLVFRNPMYNSYRRISGDHDAHVPLSHISGIKHPMKKPTYIDTRIYSDIYYFRNLVINANPTVRFDQLDLKSRQTTRRQ
ncbi:uncharacterized protein MCYG_01402 [Microsporum canis CBS 113480]|uniref:Uncharacterized protein n=1 Tax=Arthroderma otae (strain ATCC MYA-4605 / CBS 113480) TaxID=554155 RepID=C5FFD0_ARTOC|nr:uncharacterized protein MCYG_01402 [Microsporum canis CBS 113480]EEQ28514.1 predicted protein [Microsporum canis CBS 113480]